jgi:hypothetical protein
MMGFYEALSIMLEDSRAIRGDTARPWHLAVRGDAFIYARGLPFPMLLIAWLMT